MIPEKAIELAGHVATMDVMVEMAILASCLTPHHAHLIHAAPALSPSAEIPRVVITPGFHGL
jgi:hypothetical protein